MNTANPFNDDMYEDESDVIKEEKAHPFYERLEEDWKAFSSVSESRGEPSDSGKGESAKLDVFPDRVDEIHLNKYLGGSSGVRAGYYKERLLVVKQARSGEFGEPSNREQIIEEYITDRIYSAFGHPAAFSRVYEGGESKISVFIPGKDLYCFSTDSKEYEFIKEEIKKGYVLDCFLANWDVIGTAHDNIRLGVDGKVYRIDNGGSLHYRARGALKDSAFGPNVVEIDTMRESNPIFSTITNEEIFAQIDNILRNRERMFQVVDSVIQELSLDENEYADLRDILELRLQYLDRYVREKLPV